MGLFATLAASAGGGGSSSTADDKIISSSSGAHLSTAVQLHTSRRIDFLSGTIDGRGGNSTKRQFEVLSYQAVEVTAGGGAAGEGTAEQVTLLGVSAQQQRKKKHLRPNLGVWDCRLPQGGTDSGGSSNNNELVDRLLEKVIAPLPSPASTPGEQQQQQQQQQSAPPTVIFAVDLSDPSGVYPAMNAMVSALVRRYDSNAAPAKTASAAAATTRVSKLRTTKFGAAPESSAESSADAKGAPPTDAKISLIICCAVPPNPIEGGGGDGNNASPPLTFQEKQAASLAQYHLHRFASEMDCTLAFVRADDDGSTALALNLPEGGADQSSSSSSSGSKGAIPSITVSKFAVVVSRVASGLFPLEEEDKSDGNDATAPETREGEETKEGGNEDDNPASAAEMEQPSVYAPGTHDDDLIGSVLLRNASCPGVWDAAKDDLWKALPPKSDGGATGDAGQDKSSKDKKGVRVGGAAADEAWLSKLAASLPAHGAASGGDDASVKTSKSKGSASGGGSSLAKASGKKKKPTSSKASKEKNDDPTSFFENLMKK